MKYRNKKLQKWVPIPCYRLTDAGKFLLCTAETALRPLCQAVVGWAGSDAPPVCCSWRQRNAVRQHLAWWVIPAACLVLSQVFAGILCKLVYLTNLFLWESRWQGGCFFFFSLPFCNCNQICLLEGPQC